MKLSELKIGPEPGTDNITLADDGTVTAVAFVGDVSGCTGFPGGGGGGDVTGPGATVTDNAVATFDGTGGLTIQQTPVIIDPSNGNVTGVGTVDGRDLAADGSKLDGIASGAEVNAVDSVNSQTGAVSLDADDIDDAATTNRFVTAGDQTNLGNLSGTNSGDVSLAGTPDYITISGQTITRNAIDLAADVTGTLPVANGGTGSTSAGDARTALGVDAAGTDNSTDVSLAGTPNYLTLAGQVITRALIDLTAHVTGRLPWANVATIAEATIAGRASGAGTGDVTALTPTQARTVLNVADGADVSPVTLTNTVTLTNKRITPRTGTTTSSATPTINTDNVDLYVITAQAADITSMTTNLSGTPSLGDMLDVWITGTAARAITWGASFASGPATLPGTTITTKTLYTRLQWDGSIWRCMATGSNP